MSYSPNGYLLVGYTNGFHIWHKNTQLCAYKQADMCVTYMHSLARSRKFPDEALVALVCASSPCTLQVFSLQRHAFVHEIALGASIQGVCSKHDHLLIAVAQAVFVFDSHSLDNLFNVCPRKVRPHCLDLGARWMVYADEGHLAVSRSVLDPKALVNGLVRVYICVFILGYVLG